MSVKGALKQALNFLTHRLGDGSDRDVILQSGGVKARSNAGASTPFVNVHFYDLVDPILREASFHSAAIGLKCLTQQSTVVENLLFRLSAEHSFKLLKFLNGRAIEFAELVNKVEQGEGTIFSLGKTLLKRLPNFALLPRLRLHVFAPLDGFFNDAFPLTHRSSPLPF
jgi:hypothetical protein